MFLRDFREQPIIQRIGAYGDYPFDALEPTLASQLYEAVVRELRPEETYLASLIMPLLRLIECYLQISGQRLHRELLSCSSSTTILREFVGALHSQGFVELKPSRRLSYVYALGYLAKVASTIKVAYPQPWIAGRRQLAIEEIASLTALAESRELNPHKVWLWRNWPSTNKAGKITWHPLFHINKRFGRAFTERFYQSCDRYFSARRADKIDGLKQFCIFVGNSPKVLHEDSLCDPLVATDLLKDFCWHFFSEGHSAGWKMHTLKDQWSSFAETFVKGELIPSGLLNVAHEAVPMVARTRKKSSSTHVVKTPDGYAVKTKLVTPIPLHVSDPVAIEMLFHQIRLEFDVLVTWAKTETENIWFRHCRSKDLATTGNVRRIMEKHSSRVVNDTDRVGWAVSRTNPCHLANAAATFKHYGYLTQEDASLQLLFPRPLDQTAHELGLPTVQSLLPHCTLLTATHPEITPAFLETLELYDKNGKRVGIDVNDSGTFLVGYKRRKGPAKSQQIVHLNEETASIVDQIVEITTPLRIYLKNRGDDDWRYLLLTCKKSFGYPGRIQRLASDTSRPSRMNWLARRLTETTGIDFDQAQQLAKRFSLPALRATAGTLVYLETKNVKEMARALGHTTYDSRLLQHYLPEPILGYFQERWVRLFQTGIIVEAMKDSDFLLEASGFSTMDEVDEFLRLHALRAIPASQEQAEYLPQSTPTNSGEIIFGLSVGVLTTLLSLTEAVVQAKRAVNRRAKFWAELGTQLVSYLEKANHNRPDLWCYLQTARERANPGLMERIIYA